MMLIAKSQLLPTVQLQCALGYAVIQSWDEFMPDSVSGLIHIEYQAGSDGSLDFLLIWASTLWGYWNLVCEYWPRPLWSHAIGLRYSNNYHSVRFAHALEFVMAHEEAFSKLPNRHGPIQIYPPTQEQRREAERWSSEVYDNLGPIPMEPQIAS
ncbi:MAG TPA: hypothetical protein VN577_11570 [Terriglobales bacterium]|nr:hypothetical protein [Terriglobales bacterium]